MILTSGMPQITRADLADFILSREPTCIKRCSRCGWERACRFPERMNWCANPEKTVADQDGLLLDACGGEMVFVRMLGEVPPEHRAKSCGRLAP